MNQREAEQVYLYQVKRTEKLIETMGDNPQAINALITNTYAALSQKESAFLWFSLGTRVSSAVGKNLQIATQIMINSAGQAGPAKTVLENFSKGNQDIFKNIVPLFLTYESIGLDGVELLAASSTQNPFKNDWVLKAIKDYALLHEKQSIIANSLNLPLNDPKVIAQLFSDRKNIDIAHSATMGIVKEEQNIVQDMYNDELLNILLDPTLSWAGNQLKLDEIKILDKSYVLLDYIDNPADFEQRRAFAEVLLTAIDEGISKGEFSKHQADVLKAAEQTLWMANPNTAPHAIGEVNGAYWGHRADEHDQKVKDSILSFINDESLAQETALANPVNLHDQEMFPSVFAGEHEIVKVNMDPLGLFLANNPNYEVIAHNLSEITNSTLYNHTPVYGRGIVHWNNDLPYLKNGTTLDVGATSGNCYYYQPHGEVRGVTFPFMYDKTTGVPLTMPIVDTIGTYSHASTIDTIYNDPQVFNTPSHINWYNPYWNAAVQEARQNAMNNYLKSISVDRFVANIMAPFPKSFEISGGSAKAQVVLKGGDIFHDNSSGNIDFSSFKGAGANGGSHVLVPTIVSMELANGMLFEVKNGNFACTNCNGSNAALLESAANAMLHHI